MEFNYEKYITSWSTRGGRYWIGVKNDGNFWDIITDNRYSMNKSYNQMVANVVKTIYDGYKIDKIRYLKQFGKLLEGEIALFYNSKSKWVQKVMIFSIDDPIVQANKDKVSFVTLNLNFEDIVNTIEDFNSKYESNNKFMNIITITKDVKVGNYILEKGDKIKLLQNKNKYSNYR